MRNLRNRGIVVIAAVLVAVAVIAALAWPHRIAEAAMGAPLVVKGMQVCVDSRRDVGSVRVGGSQVRAEGVFIVLRVTITTTVEGRHEVANSLFRVADARGFSYEVASVTSDLQGGSGWGIMAQRGRPQSVALVFDVPPGFVVRWLEVAPLLDTPEYTAEEHFTVAGRVDVRSH